MSTIKVLKVLIVYMILVVLFLIPKALILAQEAPVFSAEYFNNTTIAGEPVLERFEESINYDWGNGSPDSLVNTDNFSARWQTEADFEEATYGFVVTADDGVMLYVDDELLINKWVDQPPTTYVVQKSLTAGNHSIRMEYYEKTIGATAKLDWTKLEQQEIPEISPGNFLAEYYNNRSLSGSPSLYREESVVLHDWGDASPDSSINSNDFSARWSTTQNLEEGAYEFTVTADDGVRLFVDGELVIDQWVDQPPTVYQVLVDISAGEHTFVMEYYERGGGAVANLDWVNIGEITLPPPPPSGEFLGEYFNNTSLIGEPILSRNEAEVNYNWGNGSPDSLVNSDNFSARWSTVQEFEDANYEFVVTADDGVRLYVDGQLIIDQWINQAPTTYKSTQSLSVGEHTIVLEYYEKTVGATAVLSWQQKAATQPITISPDSFSFVVLPDTQKYAESYPEIFTSQVNWIKDNKESLDIRFVLHEGDVVENPLSATEWERAKSNMDILDLVVPYVLAVGNHDMPNGSGRDTSNFNAYFPLSKFSQLPEFGGLFELGKMDNTYQLMTVGDIDFLVLSLEFGPRDAVLDWANQVVESYPQRKVILLTHDYIYDDSTLHGSSSSHIYGPDDPVYGLVDYNIGVQIWEKFVRKHANILFAFNGHVHQDDGAGTLVGVGDNGNRVYQMFANYQHYANGGNGYLRFIEVNPVDKQVNVKTYSPYLDEYLTSSSQEFGFNDVVELDYFSPAPVISGVVAPDKNTVLVEFSKAVDSVTSQNITNYSLSPNVEVNSTNLLADGRTVSLATQDLTVGDYIVFVNYIEDTDGNVIGQDSSFEFSFTNTSSLSTRITSSSDDAEEFSSGEMYLDSSDLELVHEDYYITDQVVGLRFVNLGVPQGATIASAYLQFTTDELNSRDTSIDIYGELTEDSQTFSTEGFNISSRVRTIASAQWLQILPWTLVDEAGSSQKTVDISVVLQEIINLPTWQPGSALALILEGSGRRVAYSYEGSAAKAPLLFIEWEN